MDNSKDHERPSSEGGRREASSQRVESETTAVTVTTATDSPPITPATERTSASESLLSLEQDIAAKQDAVSGRIATPVASSSLGSNLTQLERDVLAKASATPTSQAQRPGAVAVNVEGGDVLLSFERDVASKQAASGQPSSLPGAQHVPSTDANTTSLSQMERDVFAKSAGRSTGNEVRPGVQYVSSTSLSNLTAFEQDVAAKSRAGRDSTQAVQTGAVQIQSLSRLEQDVLAKASSGSISSTSQPGVAHVAQAGQQNDKAELTRLERDVLSKASVGRSAGKSQPGVISVTGPSSLASLERDVASKAGLPTQSLQEPTQLTALSQLERDVLTKSSLGPTMRSGGPGATSISGASSLAALERDVEAKRHQGGIGRAGPSASVERSGAQSQPHNPISESLGQLERDVLTKTTVGLGRGEARPGSVAVSGIAPPAASLAALERDVAAKNSVAQISGASGSLVGSSLHSQNQIMGVASALTQLENDALLKGSAISSNPTRAGAVDLSGAPGLRQLEADVHSKQTSGNLRTLPLDQLEADVLAKVCSTGSGRPVTRSDLTVLEEDVLRKAQTQGPAGMPSTSASVTSSVMWDEEPDEGGEPATRELMDTAQRGLVDLQTGTTTSLVPEGPVVDNSSLDIGNIEAFVAENVLDATGVTVIASEEDEERKQWTRQKRKYCLSGLVLASVVIVVVVILVVLVGGKGGSGGATSAPSQAPTAAPTMAPTTSIMADLIQDLSPISGEDAFADRDSPQYMSVEWLAVEDTYDVPLSASDPRFLQRYALAVVYFALGGPFWRICSQGDETCTSNPNINSWLSPTDECTWYGLTCGDGGLLEEFYFMTAPGIDGVKDIMLDGELPYEITLLTELTDFVINGFELHGPILDSFSKSPNLQTLVLASNNITGEVPESIGTDSPNLQTIILAGNQMTGSLPSSLGQLSGLLSLQLNGNGFGGPVVEDMFALTKALQRLELQNNQFSGELPASIYGLTDLEILRFDDTNFDGPFSSDIAQLRNLRELDVSGSLITGPVPTELYTLGNLTSLRLSQAEGLSGTLSDEIGQLNGTLEYAFLDGCGFTGPVPLDGLGALTNLKELRLFGNELTGTIAESSELCKLVFAGQIELIRTDCSLSCGCCAKCIP